MKRENLINTKIYANCRSLELFTELQEIGFSFPDDSHIMSYPFFYPDSNGDVHLDYDMNLFDLSSRKEIKVEEILGDN